MTSVGVSGVRKRSHRQDHAGFASGHALAREAPETARELRCFSSGGAAIKTKSILRFSALAAVVAALLMMLVPAEAAWHSGVDFSATFVAPPLAITVGDRPFFHPWYRHYWRPYCGPVVVPYAAPIIVTPPLARVFVRFPYPHWVPRPLAARRYWHRGY